MHDNEFATMRDTGAEYGLTSHDLANYLKRHDYRTDDGKPSSKAFETGMVRQRFAPSGHYCWAWHVGNTRSFLELMGKQRNNRG